MSVNPHNMGALIDKKNTDGFVFKTMEELTEAIAKQDEGFDSMKDLRDMPTGQLVQQIKQLGWKVDIFRPFTLNKILGNQE